MATQSIAIDALVEQLARLIVELQASGGEHTSLAHVPDFFFVSLARQLEATGMNQKVVADLFSMPLRTYQGALARAEGRSQSSDEPLAARMYTFVQPQRGRDAG